MLTRLGDDHRSHFAEPDRARAPYAEFSHGELLNRHQSTGIAVLQGLLALLGPARDEFELGARRIFEENRRILRHLGRGLDI